MYRLVLYVLIVTLTAAVVLGFAGKFSFNGFAIFWCTLFLVAVSYLSNWVFSKVFEAPTNVESVYITALILALIITPARTFHDFMFLGWAALLAQASKYILAIGKKHIFNPAAIAVVLTAFVIGQSASWWVGNMYLAPFVVVGGFLIARKIRREDMVWYFLLAAIVTIVAFTVVKGNDAFREANNIFLHSSLFFFAFIMLTEPLTTPPTARLQVIYALIVGVLFAPQIHVGSVYSTPELALVLGNVFSYLVSPKTKLVMNLKERIQIAPDTYDFVFGINQKIKFVPGQYMEFTLAHANVDDRGNRRYFTLASSPTEDNVRIGVKFYNPASSYKKEMLVMDSKTPITMTGLSGDFTLPKDNSKKLVFMAGGIGITPFRSIVKYLLDTEEKRDIVLLYSNKSAQEAVYRDVFDQAQKEMGLKAIYVNTATDGRLDRQKIETEVPDYKERQFYLSGPHVMVTAFEGVLKDMGVPANQIVTDYFPGYV